MEHPAAAEASAHPATAEASAHPATAEAQTSPGAAEARCRFPAARRSRRRKDRNPGATPAVSHPERHPGQLVVCCPAAPARAAWTAANSWRRRFSMS